MTYRPRIPDDVHERVEMYTVGKRINENRIYIEAVKILYDEEGSEEEWVGKLREYCDRHDEDISDVLNSLMESIFDNKGEADIQFKERLDLD